MKNQDQIQQDERFFYFLGYRDLIAAVLSKNFKELKFPKLAQEYKERFGEHFTLNWHLS